MLIVFVGELVSAASLNMVVRFKDRNSNSFGIIAAVDHISENYIWRQKENPHFPQKGDSDSFIPRS